MIRTPEDDLVKDLQDLEYTKLYGASDSRAEIAITLSKAREAVKKTQTQLAQLMNLSQPYISKLEGGEDNPTIGTIGSILAVLGFRLFTDIAPLLPEQTQIFGDVNTTSVPVADETMFTSPIGTGTYACDNTSSNQYPNQVSIEALIDQTPVGGAA